MSRDVCVCVYVLTNTVQLCCNNGVQQGSDRGQAAGASAAMFCDTCVCVCVLTDTVQLWCNNGVQQGASGGKQQVRVQPCLVTRVGEVPSHMSWTVILHCTLRV